MKLTTDREASRGLFATTELLVQVFIKATCRCVHGGSVVNKNFRHNDEDFQAKDNEKKKDKEKDQDK